MEGSSAKKEESPGEIPSIRWKHPYNDRKANHAKLSHFFPSIYFYEKPAKLKQTTRVRHDSKIAANLGRRDKANTNKNFHLELDPSPKK